jgi:hypothetical protein
VPRYRIVVTAAGLPERILEMDAVNEQAAQKVIAGRWEAWLEEDALTLYETGVCEDMIAVKHWREENHYSVVVEPWQPVR